MEKVDLKKEYKNLYSASAKEAVIVEVPEFNYLMINGNGDPNKVEVFNPAVETLYTTAYTIKGFSKTKLKKDFVVQPLEGLWWVNDLKDFSFVNKDNWNWTLMILLPGFITNTIFIDSIEKAKSKKEHLPFYNVRFENLCEGKSAQILHIGPYSEEQPTIRKLHSFVEEKGLQLRGKHHEIYLSDPRKTPGEKLKTILRHPVN
ncbi:MAG: hypothetical protein C0412_02660 [Flavobacterium sp.]|nr:hypothetical protein [Flavobacterium sp.]